MTVEHMYKPDMVMRVCNHNTPKVRWETDAEFPGSSRASRLGRNSAAPNNMRPHLSQDGKRGLTLVCAFTHEHIHTHIIQTHINKNKYFSF